MPITNDPREIVRKLIQEVWNEGHVEASGSYIAARYTIHHDPGDPWEKKELDLEGYKERVRLSSAPFPDQHFEIRELLADGNTVVVTWHWTGTHRGDIQGFRASGKKIRMSGITVYYVADGKVTGHWQVIDRLGVYQRLRQAMSAGNDT